MCKDPGNEIFAAFSFSAIIHLRRILLQICGIIRITKLTDLASMFTSDEKILEELVDCMVSCAVVNRSAMELVVEVDKDCKKFGK